MNKVFKTILSVMIAMSVLSSCDQGSSNKGTKQESLKALEAETLKYLTGTWEPQFSTHQEDTESEQQYLKYDEMTYTFFTISSNASINYETQNQLSLNDSDKNQDPKSYFEKSNFKYGQLRENSAGEIIIEVGQELIDQALADGVPWEEIQHSLANPTKIKIDEQGQVSMVMKLENGESFSMRLVKVDEKTVADKKSKAQQYAEVLDAKIKTIITVLKGKTFKMIDKRFISKTDGVVNYEYTTQAADIKEEEPPQNNGHIQVNAKTIFFENMLTAKVNGKYKNSINYNLSKDLKSVKIQLFNPSNDSNTYYSTVGGFLTMTDSNNLILEDIYIYKTNDGKKSESNTIYRYTAQ